MKKVAIYSRVATVNNDIDLIGLQEYSLIQFAVSQGYTNCACYRDNGVSGLRLERPGMNEMMAAIRKGMIDVVIVKDASRVARDLPLFVEWMDLMCEHEVEVISVSEGGSLAESLALMRTWLSALK